MQLLVDLLESTFLLSVMSLRRSKDKCTLSFFARKAKKNAFCRGRQKTFFRCLKHTKWTDSKVKK